MLMSCRLTLKHHTPPWLHTTRAKVYQYDAKDFDVIANVPQKEYIFKKNVFLLGSVRSRNAYYAILVDS